VFKLTSFNLAKALSAFLITILAVSLVPSTALAGKRKATIKAAGEWRININKIVSDGCNQGEAPGEDYISIKQSGAKITFTDLGGNKFKGKASNKAFSGNSKINFGFIKVVTSIEFAKISGKQAKLVTYKSSATDSDGRECISIFTGRGKRL